MQCPRCQTENPPQAKFCVLALSLASPASDYMTGQTLDLDGGLTL